MKYLTEYRDPEAARRLAEGIKSTTRQPWIIMEICGGQTHSIVKNGIDELLPEEIALVHGPGCPVCVTPLEMIDRALAIAATPEVIFCTFGDMMRVPGSEGDLFSVKAGGGDVRMIYSPLDAVKLAQTHPERQVVFFAVGFETTAPANAMAVYQASKLNLDNFSLLVSQVRVPPAMELILGSPTNRVQGFLAAGHVCTVEGYGDYGRLAEQFGVPIVVTGFEPLDILQGIYLCIKQLEAGTAQVENSYSRAVRPDGNPTARELVREVFTVTDRQWRGIGNIPDSGLRLADAYRAFDAEARFDLTNLPEQGPNICLSGEILQGMRKPPECPAFGKACTPEHPLGATMVSNEGACAAYYRYRLHEPASR